MKALLSHHKVRIALEPDEDKWTVEQKKRKAEIEEEAYNLQVLNLADQVLRKVSTELTAYSLWSRLVSLYVVQHAPNLAYLKAATFSFRMNTSKSIDENLDEFLRMTL